MSLSLLREKLLRRRGKATDEYSISSIYVPGSKIYARGFKNRDTAWVEYPLGFEVIVLVVCVYSCAASAPYSMDFVKGGKANLSV